jgi:CHASE2 domain-containing sensor protein
MDEWFYDRLMSLHKHKNRPTDIVLVRINNPSLSQSFLREAFHYPKDDLEPGSHARTTWHNAFYTSLLTKLNQYKPQAIIFTSYFDSVDQPQLTEPLPPNVILSAYLNEESKLIPPPMALTSGTPYGFSNVFPDSDNVVRRAQLVYSSSSSLAIRTHHLINPKPISRSLIEPLLIDYRGPAGSYLTIDSKDILEDEISARNLQGKVILIGREGSRYSEYETPMGKMTKLEIQANIIDNFLTQEEIRLLPRWVNYLISTIAVGTSVALILYLSLTVAWISLLVMCGLFLAISYAFMAWGGTIGVAIS